MHHKIPKPQVACSSLAGVTDGKSEEETNRGTRKRVHITTGFVYFFAGLNTRLIKIGFSRDVETRQRTLESQSGQLLQCLFHFPGTPQLERMAHRRFADLRMHGEWFRPGVPLLRFIATWRRAAWREMSEIGRAQAESFWWYRGSIR